MLVHQKPTPLSYRSEACVVVLRATWDTKHHRPIAT
ncbi:hypothetical protein Pan216_31830 [Planctomycetes bacterium Pan216]|uniref:Uncharacterized protein n=1 Tax=Kolteria novifilia TaxID=2527975 RepID=A0A518B5S9_9BACT|nr:hypothetical protein Pan216_31830 [Planctomycetes bacterium Pan216]